MIENCQVCDRMPHSCINSLSSAYIVEGIVSCELVMLMFGTPSRIDQNKPEAPSHPQSTRFSRL